jgi:hypothetical protein
MRVGRLGLGVLVAIVATAPGVASGHGDVSTDAQHVAEDTALHSAAAESQFDAAHARRHGG